jgi:hypothetical protein
MVEPRRQRREQEHGSPDAKPLDSSGASVPPTARAAMALQRFAGNGATAQLLAPERLARARPRLQRIAFLQRETIEEKDVTKTPMNSQFKDFYTVNDGRILSVRKGRTPAADADSQQEYDAMIMIQQQGIPVPEPKLVDFRPLGAETTRKGIAMNKVPGAVIDFNKIANDQKILDIVLGTLRGEEQDTTEAGFGRSTSSATAPRLQERHLLKALYGLGRILKSTRDIAINDLQVIIGAEGTVTVFDPVWAGRWADVKPAEKVMIETAYSRVKRLGDSLVGQLKASEPRSAELDEDRAPPSATR